MERKLMNTLTKEEKESVHRALNIREPEVLQIYR